MKVIYHNRSRLSAESEAECKATYVSKEELLKTADHVMLVVPYSASSHHTIGAAELAQMKPTATLINIARGGIVDDAALALALRNKQIAAAGLDVLEYESKDFESIFATQLPAAFEYLLASDRVMLSPHVGGWTKESYFKLSNVLADKILEWFDN
jgi:gluconate 2-dehydrogenase